MKKDIWNMLVTIFLLVGLSSMRSFAEGGNEVRLDQEGIVTIISPSAEAEKISSLQFSVTVDVENADRVEFAFEESKAKITEYRYNADEKKLNIYVAGTEALFVNTDTLKMGKIMVLDGDGKEIAAKVGVIADSVQYVYGTELRAMEGVTVSEPIHINGGNGSQGDNSTGGDNSQGGNSTGGDSSQGGNSTGGDNSQGGNSTGGDNSQGGSSTGGDNSQGGNDSQDDDDDDDDDSQNSASQGTVPSQGGTNQSQRPNGTQIAGNHSQGGNQTAQGNGTQETNNGSQASGNAAENTPAPVATTTPTLEPATSASGSSGEASQSNQPSSTPEMLPTGSNQQDKTESSGGTNWILVVVIIAVVLLVGVGAMAVVVLNGKPKSKQQQQDDFYDQGN